MVVVKRSGLAGSKAKFFGNGHHICLPDRFASFGPNVDLRAVDDSFAPIIREMTPNRSPVVHVVGVIQVD